MQFDLISMSRNENDSSNIIILLLFAMPLLLILIASGLEKTEKSIRLRCNISKKSNNSSTTEIWYSWLFNDKKYSKLFITLSLWKKDLGLLSMYETLAFNLIIDFIVPESGKYIPLMSLKRVVSKPFCPDIL